MRRRGEFRVSAFIQLLNSDRSRALRNAPAFLCVLYLGYPSVRLRRLLCYHFAANNEKALRPPYFDTGLIIFPLKKFFPAMHLWIVVELNIKGSA